MDRLQCMLKPASLQIPPPSSTRPLLTPSSSSESDESFRDLKRLFHHFDMDGDGKLSPVELQNCIRTVGEELSCGDADAIVRSSDSDGDGLLSFDDFVKLATHNDDHDDGDDDNHEEEEEKGKCLWEAFRMYVTEEGEGCITPNSLRRALEQLGKPMTIQECSTMIRRYDINGDGVICFDEFKAMML